MFDHVPSKHNFHRMCTIIYEIKRSKVWSLYMTLKFLATAKLFFGILYALMVEKLWTQDSEYRPMDSCILRISRQSELRHKTRRQVWGSWRLWRRAGRGGTLAATVRNIPRIPEAASRGPGRRPWLQPAVTLPSPSLASFRTRTRGRGTPAPAASFRVTGQSGDPSCINFWWFKAERQYEKTTFADALLDIVSCKVLESNTKIGQRNISLKRPAKYHGAGPVVGVCR